MNTKLVESLVQIIKSLSEEEQRLLETELKYNGDIETSEKNQELPFYETATPEERAKAFREWAESHKGNNFPQLSDEDISRESIYGERG